MVQAFIDGGVPTMTAIAVVGVLTVMLIIERFLTLSKCGVDKRSVTDGVFNSILRGDISTAISFCDAKVTPLTDTLKAGTVQVMNKREDEEVSSCHGRCCSKTHS